MNMTKMITMKVKIKAKVIMSMYKYQRMKGHILIILTMIIIRMITNKMIIILRVIGQMNLRLIILMMIVNMIKMM